MARAFRTARLQLLLLRVPSAEGDDQTDITDGLNSMIARSDTSDGFSTDVYTGGKGVLVRNPLDNLDDRNVLPATFWVNDIFSPSQLYPVVAAVPLADNVDCPNDADNGYFNIGSGCDEGPWNFATMAFVIGQEMEQFFPDFDNIQSSDWGWGVFYPSDSNSVDYRCRWLDDGAGGGGYDCPGGWISSDGSWAADTNRGGAGYYDFGNPNVDDSWGGGTGCHKDKGWIYDGDFIDQTDAYDDNGLNLIGDSHCQCDYTFNDGWEHWVQHWISHATPKAGGEAFGWFGGGLAPTFALDQASCWVSNPRDMIMMQNQLWWQRYSWNNGMAPQNAWSSDPQSLRVYWGWNEVPIPFNLATDPSLWDAVVIKLPAAVCGGAGGDDSLWCLGGREQQALEQDIDSWLNAGYLNVGWDYVAQRPGSYVVLVREWMDDNFNWQKFFFCEGWTSPSNRFEIIYSDRSLIDGKGACYIEWASGAGALGSAHNETLVSV